MNMYDHAKFVEGLKSNIAFVRQDKDLVDLGNDTVYVIKTGYDEAAEPMNDEEMEMAKSGNFDPYYINIDVYYRGINIGGDSIGNCTGDYAYYQELREEMISGLDVAKMRVNFVKHLQEQIDLLSK